jgi:hypothetical protein
LRTLTLYALTESGSVKSGALCPGAIFSNVIVVVPAPCALNKK